MKDELNLKQAEKLLDYLKNSSGKETSNVEILCGLALCFAVMFLEQTIKEMKNG